MRRLTIGALVAITLLVTSVAADAQVVRTRSGGEFAEAVWDDPQSGAFGVIFAREEDDHIILQLQTVNRDAAGDVTGFTDIYADANLSPYGTLTMDRRLESATIDVVDVPAQRCEFDANFELVGCAVTTIDAHATWTGLGRISRTTVHRHEVGEGFSITTHSKGASRQAAATGTIDGTSFTSDEQIIGLLSDSRRLTVTICRLDSGCSGD